MKGMERVFEPRRGEVFALKGKWGKAVFGNVAPLILELACGRGDYTVALAERFPDRNFIGIDVKGARMWHGCKDMQARGLRNAAFLRIRIEDLLDYFEHGEVSEIWLTFPDPQPSKENKRLMAPGFLEMYRKVLVPGGFFHLKHDDVDFFEYSLETARQCGVEVVEVVRDVNGSAATAREGTKGKTLASFESCLEIQTTYEKRHLAEGRTIRYAKFKTTEKPLQGLEGYL